MHFKSGDDETICALSTAPGVGGIAVIRVSGGDALRNGKKLCRFLPEIAESHRAYFGRLRSAKTGELIDEVVVTFFTEGRSFTGEETIEISCHGGKVPTASVLRELLESGCRLAQPGEFTYRAFMNGRLDLVQAESVLSLIESQTAQAAKIALRQLQGHLSSDFEKIETELLGILAHLEASIDFSTEGLETITGTALREKTEAVLKVVSALLASYSQGRILREGLQVALVGRPNVGKSSLLNAFLKEEKAIVTAHAGTTRDLVEGQLSFDGVPIHFVDTAGLRDTEDEIEKIGIARSKRAMEGADFVFYVVDPTHDEWYEDLVEFLEEASEKPFVLMNKSDLDKDGELRKSAIKTITPLAIFARVFWVSALKREGLREVEAMLAERARALGSETSNVVTQARHLELLEIIRSCLDSALRLMREDSSPEFTSFELQGAIRAIHELLGREFDEQVIDRIFKEFCLGK